MGLLMFIVGFLIGGGIVYTYLDAYYKEYEKVTNESIEAISAQIVEVAQKILLEERKVDNDG